MRTLLSDYTDLALFQFFLLASKHRQGLIPSSANDLLILFRAVKAYTKSTEMNSVYNYPLLTQVICSIITILINTDFSFSECCLSYLLYSMNRDFRLQ